MHTLNDARQTAQRQLDAEGKKKSCKVRMLRKLQGPNNAEVSMALSTNHGSPSGARDSPGYACSDNQTPACRVTNH